MSKKKKVLLVIAAVLLIAFAFWMKGCIDIDKCLDNGGRWNYDKGVCEYQEPSLVSRRNKQQSSVHFNPPLRFVGMHKDYDAIDAANI